MFKNLVHIYVGVLCLVCLSKCQTSSDNKNFSTELEISQSSIFQNKNIESTIIVRTNSITKEILNDWNSFKILENEILKLNNNELILELSKKDIKEIFQNLEINIPDILDSNHIRSRIKVLETNLCIYYNMTSNYKIDSKYTEQLKNNILSTYYNLLNQINKTHEKSLQILVNK
tara:strand:- start:4165 stop:4686 length:522 start_codon:yes stop_codon:yes gene_type:complete